MKRPKEEVTPIYESRIFDVSFRGTTNDLTSVKIFTNKNSFKIERQISFDSEYSQISSIEYFAGSVLSSYSIDAIRAVEKNGFHY